MMIRAIKSNCTGFLSSEENSVTLWRPEQMKQFAASRQVLVYAIIAIKHEFSIH